MLPPGRFQNGEGSDPLNVYIMRIASQSLSKAAANLIV
jgi:hypothetical protein